MSELNEGAGLSAFAADSSQGTDLGQQGGQGQQGDGGQDFSSLFSDPTILNAEVMQGVGSVEDLAKKTIALHGDLHAEGKVKLPGENATPEEIAAYRKAVGAPSDPSEYGFKDSGDLPAGVVFDQQTADWAAQVFHKHNIPVKAGQDIINEWNKRVGESAAERAAHLEQQTEKVLRDLKLKFGDAYQSKMDMMRVAVEEIGGEAAGPLKEMLKNPEVGSNPDVLNFLLEVGNFYASVKGEDALKRGAAGSTFGKTPEEAKNEVNRIMGDSNDPYWQKDHPEHSSRVKYVENLYIAMNPKPQEGD